MNTRKALQAGVAAALLVSGAMVASAAHADSRCSFKCPNGQFPSPIWNGPIWRWGTSVTQQIPPCGNCFGSMWTQFASGGQAMMLTITQGSGLAGDCAEIISMDQNFFHTGIVANNVDGSSAGESVPGTPAYMAGDGYVCNN